LHGADRADGLQDIDKQRGPSVATMIGQGLEGYGPGYGPS